MASSSNWTWEQNKLFEHALVTYDDKDPERFLKIGKVIGKTEEEVKIHYQKLVDDVKAIEADQIPLPNYKNGDTTKGFVHQHQKNK